jgi:hypothetical protein
MNYPLEGGALLFLGQHSFLLVAKAESRFSLCIETYEDEYCQGVEPGDLVVVSAPEGGSHEPALMLAELVRTHHMPLLVLPKDHPGSRRLSYVVSVGPEIVTSCSIMRGTHPEQHLVCSSDELAGTVLRAVENGVEATGLPDGISVQRVRFGVSAEIF